MVTGEEKKKKKEKSENVTSDNWDILMLNDTCTCQ